MKVWTFSLLFFSCGKHQAVFPHYQSCFSLGNARAGNIRSSGGRSSPPPDPTFPRGAQPRCQTPQAFPCAHPSFLPGSIPTLCPAQAWAPLFPPTKPQSEEGTKAKPSQALPVESQVGALPASPAELNPFFLGQLQHLAVHGSLRERSQTRLLPPGAPVGMEKPPLGRQRAELHLSTSSPGFASSPHQQNPPPPEFWHSGKNAGAESTTTKKTAQRGTAPKNQPHPSTPST